MYILFFLLKNLTRKIENKDFFLPFDIHEAMELFKLGAPAVDVFLQI